MTDVLVQLSNVSKAFAGVKALQDVSLTIRKGEIHCLVGENGSGKSTLIKIIAGVVAPDEGQIVINGKLFPVLHPIDAIHEGIQIIYQDFSLFPNLTVAENIALSSQLAQGRRFVDWGEVRQIARQALDRIHVKLDLDAPVEQVSVANKQLIAISRALVHNARLIVMDEPTTALTRREVRSLFAVIKKLQQDGVATLFVSHKLNEVLEIADRMLILRNGRTVIDADAREFDQARLAYYMTGRQIDESGYEYRRPPNGQTPLLRVEHLALPGSFVDVSFELYPGEIVGLAGLLGSGRTELGLALYGIHPARSGTIAFEGKRVRIDSVQDAVKLGIGYVPEDRLTEGLFLPQSITRNIVVRTIDHLVGALGLTKPRDLVQHAQFWINALNIKTRSPELPVQTLSGGNQQRVVLAKWLASSPKMLILNGPTVGVDIGSKSEIHAIMKRLASQGMALLVISDDMPELLHTCNRILLMKRGRLVEQLSSQSTSEDELTRKVTED